MTDYQQAVLLAKPHLIVMPSLLDVMKRQGAALEAISRWVSFRYPDGSWEVDGESSTDGVRNAVSRAISAETNSPEWGTNLMGYYGAAYYLGIIPQPWVTIDILFWDRLVERLDDTERVLVTPGPGPLPPVYDIADLAITAAFGRKLKAAERELVVTSLRDFLMPICSAGIGGELPVVMRRPSIEMWSDRVRFVLDMQESGQRTLNWVMLSLLHLASRVTIHTITVGSDLAITNIHGLPKAAPVAVPLGQ